MAARLDEMERDSLVSGAQAITCHSTHFTHGMPEVNRAVTREHAQAAGLGSYAAGGLQTKRLHRYAERGQLAAHDGRRQLSGDKRANSTLSVDTGEGRRRTARC